MSAVDEPWRYRFGPLDRAGWILGLNAIQCVALTAGLIAGGLALRATGSILPATIPVLAALVVAFGRWESRPIHEWIAPLTSWVSLRSRGLDRWGADSSTSPTPTHPSRPPFLAGLRFLEIPVRTRRARATGIGVVVDPTGQVFSATLRARGREFALLEPAEQTRLLDAWGGAVGAFCPRTRPRRPHHLVRMGRPRLLEQHLAFVREHHHDAPIGESLAAYLDVVADAGPLTTSHEVLLTLSVDRRHVQRPRGRDAQQATIDTLLEELQLFTARLHQAGITVDEPLSPGDLATVLRLRVDPSCAPGPVPAGPHRGEDARLVAPQNCTPLSVQADWREVRGRRGVASRYWIAEWPRLQVPADWLATLLLHPGGIRTLTSVCEPVAPSRSRRAVDRDANRLASDEDQRTRRGFHIRRTPPRRNRGPRPRRSPRRRLRRAHLLRLSHHHRLRPRHPRDPGR